MLNTGPHYGTTSISTVSSNVTMGTMCPAVVNSKNTRITGQRQRQRQRRLFPKYAVVGMLLSTLCNPLLGVMAILAYMRARNAYSQKRYVTAESYKNMVFILGIIGISMTLMGAVFVYIYSTEKYVLVHNEVEKTHKSETSKGVGYRHGINMFRKTKEQNTKDNAYPLNTSSPEQVQVVEVIFETNDTVSKDRERKTIGKLDMDRVQLDSMMGKGKVISAMEEISRETVNTVRELDINTTVVTDDYVGTGVRKVRDVDQTRTRHNSTRRRGSNACHQLQLLLKGNSIKVRMKMKNPMFGWKPVVVEITDHTDCVVVV